MRFKGKVALVTGAGKGIGRAIAIGFGKEGADVIVNYSKSENQAKEVVREIEKNGTNAIAVKCDVSDENQVREMIDKSVKRFGRLDVLVNNAGIEIITPFSKIMKEEWNRIFDVNILGQFLCSKYASEQMRKQKYGRIVNIASISGMDAYDPDSIAYSATKAAVVNFTKNLAAALGPDILVNCVSPGWVSTDMSAVLTKEQKKSELERQIIKRFSKPEEQANAVLFLASDEASYITGSVLVVDGGYQ